MCLWKRVLKVVLDLTTTGDWSILGFKYWWSRVEFHRTYYSQRRWSIGGNIIPAKYHLKRVFGRSKIVLNSGFRSWKNNFEKNITSVKTTKTIISKKNLDKKQKISREKKNLHKKNFDKIKLEIKKLEFSLLETFYQIFNLFNFIS